MKISKIHTTALILALVIAQATTTFAQNVGINEDGSEPDESAILDVKSTDKGVLIPRMTEAQRNAIASPATSLIIYQTDATAGFYYYNGTAWTAIKGPTGTQTGEMLYWDGTEWVTVAATENEGATLQMIGGIPTWTGGTPPTPNVTNPTTGETWMDRNLGASQVATSSTDAASYGDLYQWGRAADGHQIRTSSTTTTNATTAVPNGGNSWDGLFITEENSPYDWLTPQNDNLWQGVSGTNNPCPSGYRLPTEAEWEAERASWGSNDAAGAFGSPLKLPVAGNRSNYTGSLDFVGSYGRYWSSTLVGTSSRGLFFYSSNATMGSYGRAAGFSVRCLKE